ncbi:MAG: winged helix-turn-helix transcriptional regulator [Anaerolineales bacterium]|nr:winged helix-turn-helix transcriptional regulator [Anaerolineales bacterium]
MKQHEYRLLEAISEDDTVTQAGLATQLGIAVGSVNWYIKRLIGRGYLKATRMDRTRLRYNLTPEGMSVFRRNATQYMRDSLKVYHVLRERAKDLVAEIKASGIEEVSLIGEDPELDIFRLTCLEMGLTPNGKSDHAVRYTAGEYSVEGSRD